MTYTDAAGTAWDVVDFHTPDGLHKKRLPLNDRRADGRAFVRDGEPLEPVRIYWFRGMNYQASDAATLERQFGYAREQPAAASRSD